MQEEADNRRAAAEIPAEPSALVEFLLSADSADVEFFVIKCQRQLGDKFFAAIDAAIGEERFLDEPNEDRIAELEGLRAYVKQTLQARASVAQGVIQCRLV